jgi:hypothetical protein
MNCNSCGDTGRITSARRCTCAAGLRVVLSKVRALEARAEPAVLPPRRALLAAAWIERGLPDDAA